jgi:hypothetical protein
MLENKATGTQQAAVDMSAVQEKFGKMATAMVDEAATEFDT